MKRHIRNSYYSYYSKKFYSSVYKTAIIPSRTIKEQSRNTLLRCFYHEVSYKSKGEPKEVLQYRNNKKLNENKLYGQRSWVNVEFKYSSINPADLNTIEGKYPSPFADLQSKDATLISRLNQSSVYPDVTVGGSEAVGVVAQVYNKDESGLKEGDVVIPFFPGIGTWRSSVLAPSHYFMKVPLSGSTGKHNALDLLTASTISVNPSTAYRLLFSALNPTLQPNEVIVQNGGASMVGFFVGQLASLHGVKCVSIVRRGSRTREEFETLSEYLKKEGKATLVFEEESLLESKDYYNNFRSKLNLIGDTPPRLALDCVGGESASKLLLRNLSKGGIMITYGGMSKKPITVGAGQLIFQDVHISGYWHSRWVVNDSSLEERMKIMEYIAHGLLYGSIVDVRKRVFFLSEFEDALEYGRSCCGPIREKVILKCDE